MRQRKVIHINIPVNMRRFFLLSELASVLRKGPSTVTAKKALMN